MYDFDHATFPDWEPLERIARLCSSRAELSLLDADDFMYMARLTPCDGGPVLHLYKHIHTRMYLNLDAGGHAYRWTGERIDRIARVYGIDRVGRIGDDCHVRYVVLPDLMTAVMHVIEDGWWVPWKADAGAP